MGKAYSDTRQSKLGSLLDALTRLQLRSAALSLLFSAVALSGSLFTAVVLCWLAKAFHLQSHWLAWHLTLRQYHLQTHSPYLRGKSDAEQQVYTAAHFRLLQWSRYL